MRTRRRNSAAAISLLTVLSATPAPADDEEARQSHLIDTSTERMPEVTAFPKYPSIARRDRIEGEVTVCFTIDSRGRVREPSIVSSTDKIAAAKLTTSCPSSNRAGCMGVVDSRRNTPFSRYVATTAGRRCNPMNTNVSTTKDDM